MRQFVIFSEAEVEKLYIGKPVEDEVNHITYMSEDAYKRYLEEKDDEEEEGEDQW